MLAMLIRQQTMKEKKKKKIKGETGETQFETMYNGK